MIVFELGCNYIVWVFGVSLRWVRNKRLRYDVNNKIIKEEEEGCKRGIPFLIKLELLGFVRYSPTALEHSF